MNPTDVARALGLPANYAPVLESLRRFYFEADAALESDVDLPCHKGCDACCHESVFVSAPEMMLIIEYLHTQDRLTSVTEAMLRIAESFEEDFELLELLEPGAERDEVAARIKFRCPMLGDDGACTVYPVRELNGRSFGRSYDGDTPYGCELTHERLRVLQHPPLHDARALRRRLVAAVPEAQAVRTFPDWFQRLTSALKD